MSLKFLLTCSFSLQRFFSPCNLFVKESGPSAYCLQSVRFCPLHPGSVLNVVLRPPYFLYIENGN